LSVGELRYHHNLVFPSSFGGPLYLSNFTARYFKPLLQRAGLPKTIRLYDPGHTSATLLLAANVHAKIVSERVGHSTITVPLDTYSHVLPTMQRGAAQTLGVVLSRDVATP
jgi:integrase